MEVHPLIYIGLLLLAIVCGVMVNIAKYGWKSRKWTWFFTLTGIVSMGILMVIVYTAI
jgi:energy-converting hydrogenase Eha subunit H